MFSNINYMRCILLNTQDTMKAKVGNGNFHWWQALREYSDDTKTIGFKKRIALFFVLFCIPLTVYVVSFINGTDTGLTMDSFSSSFLSSMITSLFAHSTGIVQRIGEGLVSVSTLPCVSVIAMSMIAAFITVIIVAIVVKIERVVILLWETSNHIERLYR